MSKKVWLYSEKERDLGIYYCMDDGWYYWKDMETPDSSHAVGISLICGVILRYLGELGEVTFHASTWNVVFIVINLLLFIFMRAVRKDEEKKYHKYYPDRDQFINHMAAIKKTYRRQIVSTVISLVLVGMSIVCWIKVYEKMFCLALEVFGVIILYINIAINGMFFKRKIMKQIEGREI